jgi:AcrR family transcriptional regulator
MSRLTRDDIITGAGRRFASHGYHGTSMRDLGDDLGILGSSIYAHVGGKQELLVAVIERGASYFDASAFEAVSRASDPDDALRRLISGHIDVVLDHRSEARTYLSETGFLPTEDQHRIADARDRYEQVFVETIDNGIEEDVFDNQRSARLSAIYVLSILNTVDRWFSDDGEVDRAGLARDIHEFVRLGLVPPS